MDVAAIAQLGERQTEDLEVPGSIPGLGNCFSFCFLEGLTGATARKTPNTRNRTRDHSISAHSTVERSTN